MFAMELIVRTKLNIERFIYLSKLMEKMRPPLQQLVSSEDHPIIYPKQSIEHSGHFHRGYLRATFLLDDYDKNEFCSTKKFSDKKKRTLKFNVRLIGALFPD